MNRFKQSSISNEENNRLLRDNTVNGNNNNNGNTEVINMKARKMNYEESFNRSNKSFDSFQKEDVKTSDKRKKNRQFKTGEYVAGKVTEQIGSLSNMTEQETEWVLDSSGRKNEGSNSVELRKKLRLQENLAEDSNFGFDNSNNKYQPKYVSGEINSDRKRKNYEYPDPRVAQRLASYERLPSTYDNVRSYEQKKSTSSIRNIDL